MNIEVYRPVIPVFSQQLDYELPNQFEVIHQQHTDRCKRPSVKTHSVEVTDSYAEVILEGYELNLAPSLLGGARECLSGRACGHGSAGAARSSAETQSLSKPSVGNNPTAGISFTKEYAASMIPRAFGLLGECEVSPGFLTLRCGGEGTSNTTGAGLWLTPLDGIQVVYRSRDNCRSLAGTIECQPEFRIR